MSRPVIFILGSGKNTGVATANKFIEKGWSVAQASRSFKTEDSTENNFLIPCDLTQAGAISKAFETLRARLGDPNVVIYNAAAAHFAKADEVFSAIPTETFAADLNVNVIGAFEAIRETLKGFKNLPATTTTPRIFFQMGNALNEQVPMPGALTLGVGKSAAAYMVSEAAMTETAKGNQFYYVDERKDSGRGVVGDISGTAHANFFWDVVSGKEKIPTWHATFVKDQGYRKFDWGIGLPKP